MELHQLRYFLAVAETLNFTRAAEECGVSQPSLTRAIQKLEAEMGGPLFRREGRRTHLTELGRTVFPRFQQAVSLTELARTE
ncbi:MAG: LysR family transcriptional regulator, partial [Pseudomonadota bacterium]